ncbi:MAG: MraY family glycosyltransferase [Planctomycetia bacterium]|nr:MraY family glycosyltransferase [Planctomycetia bacterium]
MLPIAVNSFSPSTILMPYMPVFYVAFLVTVLLTPVMRHLALRYGVVDEPDGRRKIHTRPIAYLGGVATFIGWMSGVLISVVVTPINSDPALVAKVWVPPGIILGAGTVVLCGLIDDVYSLTPRLKLFGQFLGAVLLFFLSLDRSGFLGIRIDLANMLIFPLERRGWIPAIQFMHPQMYMLFASVLSAVLAIFIIMAASNAMNLLDGLDGLCSGVTSIMAVGYLALALYLACNGIPSAGVASMNPTRITLSLALLGAVLGFLPYNFNPASIFMGDTGSMFLGYVCGAMIIMFGNDGIFRWFLGSLVIFGLPILDTFLAIVRRKLNHRPVFSPDSGHFHHFLLKRGLSVKQAALVSYGLTGLFVSFALVIVLIPTSLALGIYMVLFVWLVIIAFKMGMVYQRGGNPTAISSTIPQPPAISTAAVGSPLEPRSVPTVPHDKGNLMPLANDGLLSK